MESALAGGVCGGVEATVTYPAEYAKTQLQLRASKGGGGMFVVLRDTAKREGVRGCYRGMGVVVVGGIPKHGLRFGVHDLTKPRYGSFIAGMIGGLAASLGAIIPQETIKTTLIQHPNKHSSAFACIRHIYQTNGVFGFYKGAVPTAIKNSLNSGIRFKCQSFFKGYMPHGKGASDVFYHGVAGVMAGWTSVIFTQPFDTLKTKQQGAAGRVSLLKTVAATWSINGVRSFYAGTVPRLMRITPENAILFAIFPSVLDAVSSVTQF